MRGRVAQVWLAAAFVGWGSLGCAGSSSQRYPNDPLFLTKKPVEAKAPPAAPVTVAYSEPALPPVPALVQATVRKQPLLPPTFPGRAERQPGVAPPAAGIPRRMIEANNNPGAGAVPPSPAARNSATPSAN